AEGPPDGAGTRPPHPVNVDGAGMGRTTAAAHARYRRFSILARVASLNVTRALTWPLRANAAGMCARNGDRVRLASRLPSTVNTTRLISRPRTVAVNPALHAAGRVVLARLRTAVP